MSLHDDAPCAPGPIEIAWERYAAEARASGTPFRASDRALFFAGAAAMLAALGRDINNVDRAIEELLRFVMPEVAR